jgi:deoxyribose-phosphate aldolase
MSPDEKTVETLVQVITREVLAAYNEQDIKQSLAQNLFCKKDCASGLCVTTCFNKIGQVVNAGAERLTTTVGMIPPDLSLAGMIDHTLLKADATADKITQLCMEARKYNFASVCINPTWVKLSADLLRGSNVKVCCVVGFPLGATLPEIKVLETKMCIENGAQEIDMVINIGALKGRDSALVARDIRGVVTMAHGMGAIVKVIIEACLLTDEEKVIACLLAKEADADFVKTSTGFSTGGATLHDVELMRKTVGSTMGVKAAGGISTKEDVEKMVKAGASRIGASAGIKIVQGGAPEPAVPVQTQPVMAAVKSY